MTTEAEIDQHFIAKFSETHGAAPDGFVSALWKRVDKAVTIYHLETAAETVIRTKKSKAFPSFAECLNVIHAAMSKGMPQINRPPSDVEKMDPRWSEEASLNFCRCGLGKQAARDGWIGQLVDFVRTEKRLPIEVEIRQLQIAHKAFEDALVMTMGAGIVRQWQGAGEAIVRRNERYADFVFGQMRDAA